MKQDRSSCWRGKIVIGPRGENLRGLGKWAGELSLGVLSCGVEMLVSISGQHWETL